MYDLFKVSNHSKMYDIRKYEINYQFELSMNFKIESVWSIWIMIKSGQHFGVKTFGLCVNMNLGFEAR